MTGNSQIPKDILLTNLKELTPEIFSEGKIDWERLKATLGEDINFNNERYVLNWAGKSDVFRVLQSPSTRTLIPAKEESIDFDETENIFIEGENLEVLKILQKSYFGKIKMIYIDPPYNTGNDSFIYPDKFSETKEEYQKRVGDKDEEGYMTKEGMYRKNSKENGQYHSNWLNMMYPRLFLSKNLLKDDGAIFVSIDDNEIHNLRLLMNEIFGEENFIAQFIWKRRQNVDSRSKNGASTDHEYIICYRKSDNGLIRGAEKDMNKYSNPDNDKRGDWMSADMTGLATKEQRPNLHYDLEDPKTGIVYPCPPTGWRYEPKRMMSLIKNDEIIFPKNPEGRPRRKKFQRDLESEFTGFSTILNTVYNTQGTREVRTIFDDKEYFDFPKPKDLIKLLIQQGASSIEEENIILDFFSGSGTTAHAVMELNREEDIDRKYICVQLPENCIEKSEAFKAGYKTIAEVAKERIKRAAKLIKEDKQNELDFNSEKKIDLGFKVFKLSDSNFKLWRQQGIETAEDLEKQMELFTNPISEEAQNENMVYELLIKSGFDLNSEIQQINNMYIVNTNEMILLLESVSNEIINEVIHLKPQKVIALDKLFEGNDQLKTNTVLQMKDSGIDFKTI
ncbi:site-specific DNA-methyltransferase [Maribellus comscasis]|uniref:site-specific DNA-methyltransferase (adenine-specific) n=1 Tax=Maribellus comscasis TaxID=2681766 RepID=A0A6I6JS57_9BACT|nr:site-specific DNA-methyltransferase [Maribellus comscasis]QGY45895.1 site-specific DNA-methyltransferase [Maribellus comscasis]